MHFLIPIELYTIKISFIVCKLKTKSNRKLANPGMRRIESYHWRPIAAMTPGKPADQTLRRNRAFSLYSLQISPSNIRNYCIVINMGPQVL